MKAIRATAKTYHEPEVAVAQAAQAKPAVVAIIDQKRPGFLSRVLGKIFGKAA